MTTSIGRNGKPFDTGYESIGKKDATSVLNAIPNISCFLFFSMQAMASREINQGGVGDYPGAGTFRNGYRKGWMGVMEVVIAKGDD